MDKLHEQVNLLVELALAEYEEERVEIKKELARCVYSEPSEDCKGHTIRDAIDESLRELGVPCSLKGHRCMVSALCRCVENPLLLDSIVKQLYPLVASDCGLTPAAAERAIRHSIEVAYSRGSLSAWERYFGNTVSPSKGKPTNSEFIAHISYRIRRRMGL